MSQNILDISTTMVIMSFRRNTIMTDRNPRHKRKWQVWRTFFTFNDNSKKSKERPFIITGVSKDAVSGHKVTSKGWHHDDNPDRFYKIKDRKKAGLDKRSYADLDEVLASKKDLKKYQGVLSKKDSKKLSAKRKSYHKKKF